jgi:phosphoketolase
MNRLFRYGSFSFPLDHRLTYRRTNHRNMHVRGYKNGARQKPPHYAEEKSPRWLQQNVNTGEIEQYRIM